MIIDPTTFSTLVIAVCALMGLIGGGLGLFVFLDFRRKRAFVDYMNRRLSSGKGKDADD
jgi:hypothetical protein